VSRRRQLFIGFLVVMAFVLEVAVFPEFTLFGIQPNMILVIAVIVAVQDGPVQGAVVGFLGGLLVDVASHQVMGVGAFSTAAAALLAGLMKDFFMTYSILLPVILVFILSMVEMSMHVGALAVLGQEQLPPLSIKVFLASAFYNVLLVFVLYPLLRRLRFPRKEDALSINRPDAW